MRSFRFLSVAAVVFSIAGCMTTQAGLAKLQANGVIRVDVSDDSAYDFRVIIKGIWFDDFNGKSRADREALAWTSLKYECRAIDVLEDLPVKTGPKNAAGEEPISYVMKVKCLRA